MKQRINWDDFITLSFKQVDKLQKLVDQKYHVVENEEHWERIKNHLYVYSDGSVSNIHTSYISFLSKTNIGKMIEILDKKYEVDILSDKVSNEWTVSLTACDEYKFFTGNELCDLLWEAVKYVLESEVE